MNTPSSTTRIPNYAEFWKFYLGEHSQPLTRKLHFVGTCLVLITWGLGFAVSPWWFLASPVAGYSFAWVSHLWVEHNHPATFKYPLWSLFADFHMFWCILSGKIEEELKRCESSHSS